MNLLNAAKQGNAKKVKKLLLMAGVPCDWQAPNGRTPLIEAAWNGHHLVVELLLAKGARVNQAAVVTGNFYYPSSSGRSNEAAGAVYRTPLICAVECGSLKVVEVLLSNGADIDNTQESGATPLNLAAGWGRLAIVDLLCKNAVTNGNLRTALVFTRK